MLTVPEAAKRTGRNPETIRRWIRQGKLPSTKVGTQHLIDEQDLDAVVGSGSRSLPVPDAWKHTSTGEPMPDVVGALRRHRSSH